MRAKTLYFSVNARSRGFSFTIIIIFMHLSCPAPPKAGEKLGFQLVRSYGDDPRKGELTRAWLGHMVQTSNHWSSIPTSYAILDRVIVPHLLKVKRELGLAEDHPAISS